MTIQALDDMKEMEAVAREFYVTLLAIYGVDFVPQGIEAEDFIEQGPSLSLFQNSSEDFSTWSTRVLSEVQSAIRRDHEKELIDVEEAVSNWCRITGRDESEITPFAILNAWLIPNAVNHGVRPTLMPKELSELDLPDMIKSIRSGKWDGDISMLSVESPKEAAERIRDEIDAFNESQALLQELTDQARMDIRLAKGDD